jgi:hypothetical protein
MKATLVSAFLFALAGASHVYALDCADHAEDYEAGVEAGRSDAEREKSQNPSRHRESDGKHKNRYACYEKGYGVGYSNAAADARREHSGRHSRDDRYSDEDDIPRAGSNEREYFDDGCRRGREDGRAGMSSYYGRYSEEYDSRFEPYFARGYEKCWRENR